MAKTLTPDICVIGAGSGGLSVAAAASAFGVSVVLIEKGEMGGDCLNYGCIPSKALIASGKQAQTIRDASKFGVTAGKPKVNFKKVHDHVHSVIETIAPMDSQERFEALGVTVIREAARFKDKKTVVAGDTEIKARRFVVATGSSPFVPPIPGIDKVPHHTNETIFTRTESAGRLIVIGGGPIGMEMAQAHQRLGCDVTVIEGDRALGKDDPELAAIVLDKVREEGVTILEKTKVVKVEQGKSGIVVHVETADGTDKIEGDTLLVATGRKANVAGLDLEKAGIEYDRSIKVSNKLRTTNKKVYAIGDVAGGLQFTHVAGYHAGLVIRAMLFRLPAKNKTEHIPWSTYTVPELANVGHTEASARKAHGEKIQILRWPFAENDRAQADKKTAGLIKMITDKKGKILGVGIAGESAGEMMNMWALAVSKGMTVKDIAGYVSPYPTMTEIGKRAATSYYTPTTRKPLVRSVVNFLRMFG
ncbi:dihydrolipoyl dehydrogenase family protein [Pseudahrensia aquimaris]|uniref:Dihydrolipoyl dehydrogenase family protein n=1 Tax=Pseudahrensia aquimaris TaxID=744461 RepID=A0ABW3FEK1_9HYPH